MCKYKHLTLEDRQLISQMITEHNSFKKIGKALGRDATTISKEVKKNSSLFQTGAYGKCYNNCIYRNSCTKSSICSECSFARSIKRCRYCSLCNEMCAYFKPDHCSKLDKPPYVCNGCANRSSRCTLEKRIYHAGNAQQKYANTLSESRSGINFTPEEVHELDLLFSPLIKKGQSIHHIYTNHKAAVLASESTIYRLVDYNLFEARNIDLPRKVRFAPRKTKKLFKVERNCRINRSYIDCNMFKHKHPNLPITEMDSVEGAKGGKVLLTIHFVKAECMIAFLRERNDAASVNAAFDYLYEVLTPPVFKELMPIIVGDNGSEFSNPTAIEFDSDGNQRTHIFYCNPSAPYQKGSAERNHEFIRYFVPKGKSFDHLNQNDIDLMMSHIASYGRPSLLDKTPYEMMSFFYGESVCNALNLTYIKPDDVTLNSSIWHSVEENDNE